MYKPPKSELIYSIFKAIPSIKEIEKYIIICKHKSDTLSRIKKKI